MNHIESETYEWSLTHNDQKNAKVFSNVLSVSSVQDGLISLNPAYVYQMKPELSKSTIEYLPEKDNDNNTLFHFAYQLPEQWIKTIIQTSETNTIHQGWCVVFDVDCFGCELFCFGDIA